MTPRLWVALGVVLLIPAGVLGESGAHALVDVGGLLVLAAVGAVLYGIRLHHDGKRR